MRGRGVRRKKVFDILLSSLSSLLTRFFFGLVDTESRSWLEREYLFIDVISTFLRAIRAGAISVNHGSVLLAHYGRLGIAFDTCVKVVVDVLREEGLTGGNGELVVTVVTKAIQEVSFYAFSLAYALN